MSLNDFLSGLVGGTLTYPAANWLLGQLPDYIGKQTRFFTVLAISFALAVGAYAAQIFLGYAAFSYDGLFAVMAVAFTVSQTIWGARDA